MSETRTIDQLVEGYEVAREVLHFRSSNGLSIADYNAILNLPNDGTRRFGWCVGEEVDYEMTELVGETWVGSTPIRTFRQLWGMFLEARGELFDLFPHKQPDWCLEDIILIQDMIEEDVIGRNLHVDVTRSTYMFAKFSPSNLLAELLAVSYVLPNSELREFFVKHVNHKETQALQVSIGDMCDFALTQPLLAEQFYQHLTDHLPNYIAEIDVRHWEKLTPIEWQARVRKVEQGLHVTSEDYLAAMRTVGISDEIASWRDPEITCRFLTDIIKNGAFTGKSLLKFFWHKDNSREKLSCNCVL